MFHLDACDASGHLCDARLVQERKKAQLVQFLFFLSFSKCAKYMLKVLKSSFASVKLCFDTKAISNVRELVSVSVREIQLLQSLENTHCKKLPAILQ